MKKPSAHKIIMILLACSVLFLFNSSYAKAEDVVLVVNSDLAPLIQPSLVQYINDLELQGYTAKQHNWTLEGSTAGELRDYLISEYADGLQGAVLIGNLPIAYFEVDNDYGIYGYQNWPCDYFFAELDAVWIDSDANNIYDAVNTASGDLETEIWVGRIRAPEIGLLTGNEVSITTNYFLKNHAYRTGNLELNDRALVYIDDDFFFVHTCDTLFETYDNVTFVTEPAQTTAADYMDKLDDNYEWIHLRCHSAISAHAFGPGGDSSEGYVINIDIANIDPKSFFYNLDTCYTGRFTSPFCLADTYIFADTYGLLSLASTKISMTIEWGPLYYPLGEGHTIGESFKNWFNTVGIYNISWHWGKILLGDPTLCTYPTNLSSIAGTIMDVLGNPVGGVNVACSPGGAEGITNGSGNYLIPNLSSNSYTLTPSHPDYGFDPLLRNVDTYTGDVSDVDFIALHNYYIGGTITNEYGMPVSGVDISIGDAYTVVTDYYGNYLQDGLTPGTYEVIPSKSGYHFNPYGWEVTIANENHPGLDFTAISNIISGRVTTASGQPISSAIVSISGQGSVTTDSNGFYIKEGLVNGTHTVSVTSPCYYTFSPPSYSIVVANNNHINVNFTATLTQYRVSGTITSAYDGSYMSGVTVTFSSGSSVQTNANGYYETYLPHGSYYAFASKPGYVFDPPGRGFTIDSSGYSGFDYAGYGAYSVSGRILDNAGVPVNGAHVRVMELGVSATSDAGGYYMLDLIPSGTYHVYALFSDYLVEPQIIEVTVNGADVVGINFIVISRFSISGHIFDYLGIGISGVAVTISGQGTTTVFTNSNGDYSVSNVHRGEYTVTPQKSGHAFLPASRSVFIEHLNAENVNFEGYTSASVRTISGNVLTTSVTGISGATVTIDSWYFDTTATTSSDGNYIAHSLPPGQTYRVTPSHPSYDHFEPAYKDVEIEAADQTGVDFIGIHNYTVSGMVSDSQGRGISGVSVTVTGSGAPRTITTNALGHYIIDALSNGSYTITPTKPSLNFTPASKSITINGADYPNDVNFTCANCYAIHGNLRTWDGYAISGASVAIINIGYATSGPGGDYELLGVPNGTYTICPTKPGYNFRPFYQTITVNNDDYAADFIGLKNYAVSGYVRNPGGNGMYGVTVTISGHGTATTDFDGYFVTDNLPDGGYTVTPSKTGYTFDPPSQEAVINGDDVDLPDFDSVRTYSVISGYIKDSSGQGTSVYVNISGLGTVVSSSTTGYYEKRDVPNGTYTITPYYESASFNPASASLTVDNEVAIDYRRDFTVYENYPIAGNIHRPDGTGVQGVIVRICGSVTVNTATDSNGNYAKEDLPNGGYTLTPSKTGYNFDPPSRPVTISNSGVYGVDFIAIQDVTPPTGSISINSDAEYTNTASVTLDLSAVDSESGVSHMKFSNDGYSYSSAESYAATKAWTLAPEDGVKTVYVKYRDNGYNWSSPYSDTIILDTAAPPGAIIINNGEEVTENASVTLSLPVSMSDLSGVSQMKLSNDGSNWSAPEPYACSRSWTLSPGYGIKTVYVEYKDNAGNWSGAYSDTIILQSKKRLYPENKALY